MDEHYASRPEELSSMVMELYRYKDMNDAPPELKQLANTITNEMERLFNVQLTSK